MSWCPGLLHGVYSRARGGSLLTFGLRAHDLQTRGTVKEWRDIMAQRDVDDVTSARYLPYFEGDFWADEIERQVQKLEEEESAEQEGEDEGGDGAQDPGSAKKSMSTVYWWRALDSVGGEGETVG